MDWSNAHLILTTLRIYIAINDRDDLIEHAWTTSPWNAAERDAIPQFGKIGQIIAGMKPSNLRLEASRITKGLFNEALRDRLRP